MENASKALMMAGSILIAMMIVGALVFGYQNLSDLEQTRSDAEKEKKTSNYLTKFEPYDKETLYGSEILSLANLREEYERVCSEQEGYSKVTIWVDIKTEMQNEDMTVTYIAKKNWNIKDLVTKIKTYYEDPIKKAETTEWKDTHKTIKYFASKSYAELAYILNVDRSDCTTEDELEAKIINSSSKNKELLKEISKYRNLKSVYTQFKETKFECKKVDYDNLGRIKEMKFEEKEITI